MYALFSQIKHYYIFVFSCILVFLYSFMKIGEQPENTIYGLSLVLGITQKPLLGVETFQFSLTKYVQPHLKIGRI